MSIDAAMANEFMNDLVTAHKALVGWSEKMPDREFLLQPVDGRLRVTTYKEALDQARRMAASLIGLGMVPGDKIAILAKNSAEWVLADFSIAMAGMVSVPIYPTASANTVAYILGHSEAKAVFVGKLDEPDAISKAIPKTLATIAFPYPTIECQYDWQELLDRAQPIAAPHEPADEDVMTILYTSGSTGRPKGVVISYRAYVYGCKAARDIVASGTDDRFLSYLPLAHVTERMALIGPSIYAGSRIFFVESLDTFTRDLKTASPTVFGSVPRLWVKFQSGIHSKIAPKKLRLLLAIPIVGRLVAAKIRNEMGLGDCTRFASGTAPISPLTLKWYLRLGIDISEGWGMSETSGLSCINSPFEARRVGTIGIPLEGTELKISDEGELLIRCPGLFSEYFKQPELTKDVFTADGFFHTGDKADWDEKRNGYRISGRVKDIFKSAKGKYVVPVPIESQLSANPLLEQICVIGSGLPAPVAIVVLSEAAQHLPKETIDESLETTLTDTNNHLESHERLSNMLIVNDEWTTENGLLTPTLKVKREQLEARFLSAVDRKFSSPIAWENDL
jgi:long-subunit acyl-CoA synthetase (AMP-forming)